MRVLPPNNDIISKEKLRSVENLSCRNSFQNSSGDKFTFDCRKQSVGKSYNSI